MQFSCGDRCYFALFLGTHPVCRGTVTGPCGQAGDGRHTGTWFEPQAEGDNWRASAESFYFTQLKSRFEMNRERCLQVSSPGKPVVIFTDGSFEPDKANCFEETGVGGIMLRADHKPEVFGCKVPAELLRRWHEAGKQHLIGQIELYGVLLAKFLWRQQLSNMRSFFYIDNWGVLDCVIPGTSQDATWRDMLLKMGEIDAAHPSLTWAARVPSESNPADPPNRGHMQGLEFLGECVLGNPYVRCWEYHLNALRDWSGMGVYDDISAVWYEENDYVTLRHIMFSTILCRWTHVTDGSRTSEIEPPFAIMKKRCESLMRSAAPFDVHVVSIALGCLYLACICDFEIYMN